ncbi:MAG: acetate--CoA ligase family protein [Candidatus Micrarchaeia archaeon]|jgi:acyl-CoA synthetase (NDP forming)
MLLGVRESLALLKKYGVSTPQQALCKNFSEIVKSARVIRAPWALKAFSAGAPHKTEAGLVEANIRDARGLGEAFKNISGRARKARLHVDYFVLQKHLSGVELLVGGKRDASFGQTIVFGLGGIAVELFRDYSLRVTPITRRQAIEMIYETRASAFVKGFRGKKVSEKAVAGLLLRVSRLLEENSSITEFDLNPVIADERNAVAVDARIVLSD